MMVTPFSCVEMTVGLFLPSWRPTAANGGKSQMMPLQGVPLNDELVAAV
jgi:hypothetical protein